MKGYKMKKLFIILTMAIVFMASTAWAATNQSFQWDANTESDLAGYKIYRSMTSGGPWTEVGDKACAPNDSSCCNFDDQNIPDGTYFWIARAYDTHNNLSADSIELTKVFDTEPPAPPSNFRFWQMIISWLKHFFNIG